MSKKKRNSPLVDIIMPVYGQPDFLRGCLESLFAHDAGVPYRVILVDDVSPEPMGDVYTWARGKGCKVIKRRENGGFAATCNTGARAGKAPLILLLNTDTLITQDGWLKALADECNWAAVGVVGCLLTYFPDSDHPKRPAGHVQHAGVVFDILGRPYHIFQGWPADHPKVARRREMNCVTGACLMTKRQLWQRIGGLDEAYDRGNFEDVQYCIQVRHAGFKVVFTPDVHLHHYAGGSGNSMTATRNAKLFDAKMGDKVEFDEWRYW